MTIARTSHSVTVGSWTICKVTVCGKDQYELWHLQAPNALGRFESFEAAKAESKRRDALLNDVAGQA